MLQMGIQPEKRRTRKNDTGESVFPETDLFSLFFRFAYILFVIHRDEYRVTSPDLYQNQVLYIKKDFRDFTLSSGHEAC